MKKKKKIEVLGVPITVNKDDYVSLTNIAQSEGGKKASNLIANWLKNQKTLVFLEAWEGLYNPNFKVLQMQDFRLSASNSERFAVSPKKYIKATGAIGMTTKSGRYDGGTYAHLEIALAFAYWLEPTFQVYFLKEFNRMKSEETQRLENTKLWVLEKVIREADSVINVAELGLKLHHMTEEEEE